MLGGFQWWFLWYTNTASKWHMAIWISIMAFLGRAPLEEGWHEANSRSLARLEINEGRVCHWFGCLLIIKCLPLLWYEATNTVKSLGQP